MQQVKIWVAVCPFDDTVSFTPDNYINFTEDLFEFWFKKIIPILHSKMELKMSGVTNKERWTLKKGETYESVLQALWEFQTNLVINNEESEAYVNNTMQIVLPEGYIDFYDNNKRIITITKFD